MIRPTLNDVARTAGVSPATVSRWLNRPDSVRADKRQVIKRAVEALGYVPHGAAQALASRQSKLIGGIFPAVDNALFGHALEEFQTVLADAGYTVVVASSGYDPDMEARHIKRMLQSGIDALLLVGTERPGHLYDMIRSHGIPYVNVWRYAPDCPHPCIGFDNDHAAMHLCDHLFDLGHRRIALLSGRLTHNDRAQDRLEGIHRSHRKHGLTFDEALLREQPFGVSEGRDMFRSLMSGKVQPTAFICGSEPFAYGAIFEAAAMGFRVPHDLSIAGFDDLWLSSHLTPALTTVRTPHGAIGAEAAYYLLAKLRDEDPPPPRPLETQLILRQSTGPAPPAQL
jgi:LacI family transcriptional regulator